jgi:hypothetical protein
MPYKDPEDKAKQMREYRRKKVEDAKELRNLIKESYDPFMDSVVIPRQKLEQLHFKVI